MRGTKSLRKLSILLHVVLNFTGIFVLTLVGAQAATAQVEIWTRQFGSTTSDGFFGSEYVTSMRSDGAGNVYVAGRTSGIFSEQVSFGADDVYLRRYDSDGNVAWTRQLGTNDYDEVAYIGLDSAGSIYVAVTQSFSFGHEHPFLRKYDSLGNTIWTRQIGLGYNVHAVGVDGLGNVCIEARLSSLNSQGQGSDQGETLIKYDSAGNPIWSRSLGLTFEGSSVALDPSDASIYIAGGDSVINGFGGPFMNPHLRKYDSAGNEIWARQFGVTNRSGKAQNVAVDSNNGDVYAAGWTTLGSWFLPVAASSDAFLYKYSSAGAQIWSRQFGSAQDDSAESVAIDTVGNVYIVGKTIGALTGSPLGEGDVFLQKYDAAGNPVSTRQLGTSRYDFVGAVTVDSQDDVYVGGGTNGTFPGQTRPLQDRETNNDAFLIKFGKYLTTTSISSVTPEPSTVGQTFTISYEVVSSYGTPTGTVTVSDGVESCSGTVTSAQCSLTSAQSGSKTISVKYPGDGTFASSGATTSHIVNPAVSSLSIVGISPEPSEPGQAYSVTYSVISTVGTPTGNVAISDGHGGSCVGTATTGSCSLISTTSGTLTITAIYAGRLNFSGSSATASHVVTSAGSATQTPLGSNVTVQPVDPATGAPLPITLTFPNVTTAGGTTAVSVQMAPPANFLLNGVAYDITTTAQFAPPITVCFFGTYTSSDVILHLENGSWQQLANQQLLPPGGPYIKICAETSSLSPFGVFEPLNRPPSGSAGANQTVEATGPFGALMSLSGTGSDPDNDPLTFSWNGACGSASGANVSLTCPLGNSTMRLTVSDGRGGYATSDVQITVRDTAPPTIACAAPDTAWHATDVSITCAASDIVGLLSAADASFTVATNVAAGTETATAMTGLRSVCDGSNNCAPATPIGPIKVDKKSPVVVISGPLDGATYFLNQPVAASFSCSDVGAGVMTCNGSVANGTNIDAASLGPKTFTVSATDGVGNKTDATATYTVILSAGFCYRAPDRVIFPPIASDGTSVFKQGSTVPAKFRACDSAGNSIVDPALISSFKLIQVVSGAVVQNANADVPSSTRDTAFRWDTVEHQWIFNINTKSYVAGRTYYFRISLNDGSAIGFNFGLK